MTTPAGNNALFVAGQLAANCTDLGAAYPHGGIALGLIGSCDLVRPPLFRVVVKEENNAPHKIIWLSGGAELVVTLKSWDGDAVERLFRGGSQAATVPRFQFLSIAEIGRAVTPLANVVWVPVRGSPYPYTVLRDVVAVPEPDLRPRLSSQAFLGYRLRLIATDVDDSLGEQGAAGTVVL